ncbi:MAG: type IX secretion system membrane protein PorP/SprF [Flavobacteriales bacterium]|nr:type IX secretion system membrane protein PorP/SprF [Flavobacteriales bacterium]
MKGPSCVALLIVLNCALHAQDPDPFFTTLAPEMLDPSRAGPLPGVTATLISREQWMQLPGSFRTDVLSATMGTGVRDDRHGHWGGGLIMRHDRSGDLGWQGLRASLATAYHLRTSRNGTLSFGMSPALERTQSDPRNGRWASQYDGTGYDPSLPSGERYTNAPSSTIAMDAGISYMLVAKDKRYGAELYPRLVAGLSGTRLAVAHLSGAGNGIPSAPPRYTAHVALTLPTHAQLFDRVYFESVAHTMGPHTTARTSLGVGHATYQAKRLSEQDQPLGYRMDIGWRWMDAFFVRGHITWGPLDLGLSYGWSLPSSDQQVAGPRSVELCLRARL